MPTISTVEVERDTLLLINFLIDCARYSGYAATPNDVIYAALGSHIDSTLQE